MLDCHLTSIRTSPNTSPPPYTIIVFSTHPSRGASTAEATRAGNEMHVFGRDFLCLIQLPEYC